MIKINKEGNNTYNFSLNTPNGNALLNSIAFTSEEEIKSVVDSLTFPEKPQYAFERRTDHNGNFLFNLKDKKGKVIGKSQLYRSEAGMENGIKNLRNRIAHLKNLE